MLEIVTFCTEMEELRERKRDGVLMIREVVAEGIL